MRHVLAVTLVGFVIFGCSVENIDSRVKRQLDLCSKIRDEQLRVKCITSVQAAK